ncbi:MAG: hypothetical protein WCX73_02585 [Candidatus Pacearchaeota archaeon]|jgi:hypothetical protein
MILKILGIIDILAGICFWLFGIFHILPSSFILILGLFLLAKGVVFVTTLNVVSILDIICAIVIISSTATEIIMPHWAVILITLFLLQKGIFSMLS